VQTFPPFADFEETARSLDTRRLGKQRVETLQILRALTRPGPRRPGGLPGAGGWAVAVQDLGLVLVPGGGGAVGVQDQGPAPAVDDDQVVEPA